ncbi:amino-acid permease inda1 [Bimuria novae-zelandiae CBS 107.79]|uniref:Amino-acid permease inda1 n=1 Tax=Bimuria novae-zelandiae CBS 107.79 TaxID=1447943 RepID=A0A6A5VBK1_9PLEO|nr:amino-acid permease inda1 [Bimuria novae-zelandiae CBS 107.79]
MATVPPTDKGFDADEKRVSSSPTGPAPAYEPSTGEHWREREDFMTRNGLNLKSFQRRPIDQVDLDKSMKPRHLHMIAIGGSIGAGFFVGSGGALSGGGPASVTIDFALMGIMIFNVVYALGELAVMYPVSGGFYTYSTRFIDPSWGFAMGWNYVFQWAIVLPLEITVAGLTLDYWPNDVPLAGWITIFWLFIILINVWGTLGYAEEEFWSSLIKLSATVIFMLIAFILVLGGGPSNGLYSEYWGARTWYDPGAFRNSFKGFCGVFVTAAFSFSGTELVGLAAAETKNPLRSLPGAIKQVFWRITLFYILGLLFVGLLVRSDDPRLLGSGSGDTKSSPFVIAAKDAGLNGFDDFMNVVILISVISIGVSGVYGGSRTLTALAEQGYAPKIFAYIDRSGRPLFSVGIILLMGSLAYMNLAASGETVFNWFLQLSGLAALFTWGSICLAHIRFRKAWAHQGHTVDEIPFKALGGVYGSWLGIFLISIVLVAQFYVSISPLGTKVGTAYDFFFGYLAFFVVGFFWICGYLWKHQGWLRIDQIDLDTGRRELDWDYINAERAKIAAWPAWRRAFNKIF